MLAALASHRTLQLYHQTANPALYLLHCLAATIVALILSLTIGFIAGSEPDNDMADSAPLASMLPWPAAAFVWTLVDLAVCKWAALHPVASIVMGTFNVLGYLVLGALGVALFSWDNIAWIPGAWQLLAAVPYAVYLYIGVRAFRAGKKAAKSEPLVGVLDNSV
ncbi:hypothetical protein B0A48_12754 [Cryoendolithus antarcticus]|uniref:MARVEL domain-containing protein n=1 Tax=Cryoendolithus antarcticus TaxID=1507870 RepID=A0A1V8SRA6_9PEZI|nr:hypothetical protein B0A48_12754 [Cryoendolithus antarcticus]